MNEAVGEVLARLDLVAIEAGRRSAEIESNRALPPDLVDALIDTGVFRLAVPVTLGGVAAGFGSVVEAARNLAYHDGSTGWVVLSTLLAGLEAAHLPRHHAGTVLGDPRTVVAGHRGPGGVARRTDDGGLVVTGRWTRGSGVAIGTWIGGGVAIVSGDGGGGGAGPVPGTDQSIEPTVQCFFRRDQVIVLDTWHAMGLRGAGSTDFEVIEAFVPEGRWIDLDPVAQTGAPTAPTASGVASGAPASADRHDGFLAAGAAAVALGLAARAADEVRGNRASGNGTTPRAHPESDAAARSELARLTAATTAATVLLDRSVEEDDPPTATDPTGNSGPLTAALHAVEAATAVVDHCFRMGGADAVLHASPLQRILRDINVVAQQPAVAPSRWAELAGSGHTTSP